MRILWSNQENRFQVEFTPEYWREDQEAAKAAGFKTSGPPQWLWYTNKASVLNVLKASNPKSGVRITFDALEKYKPLNEREIKNAELKAGLKKALKELKKEADKNDPTTLYDYTEKGYLVSSDLLPMPPFVSTFKASPIPKERCMICDDPMWYPFNDKDICLWCEKELDNEKKVCENTLARENL